MKAVILAGGLGTRMREETEFRPKPMVEIGGKPILWHIMKILASQGVTEFIICVGYKGDMIRRYFFDYQSLNRDFTVRLGDSNSMQFHGNLEEENWDVTLADTGPTTLTGGRLSKIRKYLNEGEPFLITYGDGLANVDLRTIMEKHLSLDSDLTISTSAPLSRFGMVKTTDSGIVTDFLEKPPGTDVVNIGYMVAETSIFDYITGDEAFETGALPRIAKAGKLGAHNHQGFWQPMDTIREAEMLNQLWDNNQAAWKIW